MKPTIATTVPTLEPSCSHEYWAFAPESPGHFTVRSYFGPKQKYVRKHNLALPYLQSKLKRISTNNLEVYEAFSVPDLSDEVDSLDDLLLDLDLMQVIQETYSELKNLKALEANCIALDRRFAWQDSRVPECKPTVADHINRRGYEL